MATNKEFTKANVAIYPLPYYIPKNNCCRILCWMTKSNKMDLSTLNTHICEILDRHRLGSAAEIDVNRLYGTPDDTPVYGELIEYFKSSYTDILQLIENQISNIQRIEFSEHIDIDSQEKLCLLLGKIPFIQPPPLQRHDDRLDTIEDASDSFTSIFQISDSFIMFCASHRPLMDMGRVLM